MLELPSMMTLEIEICLYVLAPLRVLVALTILKMSCEIGSLYRIHVNLSVRVHLQQRLVGQIQLSLI